MRNLESFLRSRIDFIQRKSSEFNDLDIRNMSYQTRSKTFSLVGKDDFDFLTGLKDLTNYKKNLHNEMSYLDPNLTHDEIEKKVQIKLRNRSVSQMTFPEWLLIWQSHGGPGYLSHMALAAKK